MNRKESKLTYSRNGINGKTSGISGSLGKSDFGRYDSGSHRKGGGSGHTHGTSRRESDGSSHESS